jgi:hypothetical protein
MAFETEKLVIANGALLRLGAQKIDSFADEVDSARGCAQFIDPVMKETLTAYPWNFALVRDQFNSFPQATLTPSAISGTNVTFLASAPVFAETDVTFRIVGSTGIARIRTFVNTTEVRADIESNFANTAPIAIEAWRIAPAFKWSFRHALPTNYLRVIEVEGIGSLNAPSTFGWSWWQHRDNTPEPVKREGRFLVTDIGAKMNMQYTQFIEDPTLWSDVARNAVESLLAFRICYIVTGSLQAAKTQFESYRYFLGEARTADGQEGTADDSGSDTLIAVRM